MHSIYFIYSTSFIHYLVSGKCGFVLLKSSAAKKNIKPISKMFFPSGKCYNIIVDLFISVCHRATRRLKQNGIR